MSAQCIHALDTVQIQQWGNDCSLRNYSLGKRCSHVTDLTPLFKSTHAMPYLCSSGCCKTSHIRVAFNSGCLNNSQKHESPMSLLRPIRSWLSSVFTLAQNEICA